ncbi:MAG: hypothetical protein M3Z56_06145, partial [Bacteroidota bacterium]|nr:hypothetical protein [Bacteroidota bacterium]
MKNCIITSACIFMLLSLSNCSSHEQHSSTKAERDSAYSKLSDDEKRLPQNALAGLEIADGLQA